MAAMTKRDGRWFVVEWGHSFALTRAASEAYDAMLAEKTARTTATLKSAAQLKVFK